MNTLVERMYLAYSAAHADRMEVIWDENAMRAAAEILVSYIEQEQPILAARLRRELTVPNSAELTV